MAEITWGLIAKSVDDKTTIDEEIDAKILAHNVDASAHGQTNEAIEVHRVAEILDHLDESIIAAKIANFQINPLKLNYDRPSMLVTWETLDALISSGSADAGIYHYIGYAILYTSFVNNSYWEIIGWFEPSLADFDNYNFSLTTRFQITGTGTPPFTNYRHYVGIGLPSWCFAGFKIMNGNLYACVVIDSAEYTHQITGIDVELYHTYGIDHYRGLKTEFYVDEILEHTETVHYAQGMSDEAGVYVKVQTLAASQKGLAILNTLLIANPD